MCAIPIYLPVKHTGGDHRQSGARKRSYLSKAAIEKASGTKRNVLGAGALDLLSLGKGIYESEFQKEKKKLFESNFQIKRLIEDLERSEKPDEDFDVDVIDINPSETNDDKESD